jgi:hypothetical protein
MTEIELQIIWLGAILLVAFAALGLRQRGAALYHWFETDSQPR